MVQEAVEWERFTDAIGRPELRDDPRFKELAAAPRERAGARRDPRRGVRAKPLDDWRARARPPRGHVRHHRAHRGSAGRSAARTRTGSFVRSRAKACARACAPSTARSSSTAPRRRPRAPRARARRARARDPRVARLHRGAHRRAGARRGAEGLSVRLEALRPSLLVVLPEGADRALRERHAVRVPPARGGDEQVAAEHAALWPLKRMPVLVDEGRTVVEASIIIEHLGLHHPGPVRLIPEDPRAALDVRMLDRFFDNYVMTPMQKIVADRLRPAEHRDALRRRRGPRSCSTPPTAGSTTRLKAARVGGGRPLQPRRLRRGARAVLRRLGRTRSAALRRTCAPTGGACSRGRPSRARWTRRGPIGRLFPLGAPDRD